MDARVAQDVVGCAREEGCGCFGASDDDEGSVCEDFARSECVRRGLCWFGRSVCAFIVGSFGTVEIVVMPQDIAKEVFPALVRASS